MRDRRFNHIAHLIEMWVKDRWGGPQWIRNVINHYLANQLKEGEEIK